MIRILLIRHGHTDLLGRVLYGRMAGVDLSERGRQEVKRLANALNETFQLSEIVSSPMNRALETADLIAADQNLQMLLDDGLQEVDFGEWTGKPFEELAGDASWQAYNRHRSLNGAPGGESMMQVQARGWSALKRAFIRHQDRSEATIAVVTHGDVIRALLMLFLGIPLDYIHRLEVGTASVSEVVLGKAHPHVVSMNRTF